jgi:hypothetical protein
VSGHIDDLLRHGILGHADSLLFILLTIAASML